MTKKEFKKRAMHLFIEKKKYEELLNKAMESGIIDFEHLPDNYLAVYPVAAAIYKETTRWFLEGCNDPKVRRQQKRESSNIYAIL
jgi:hypothetical protein